MLGPGQETRAGFVLGPVVNTGGPPHAYQPADMWLTHNHPTAMISDLMIKFVGEASTMNDVVLRDCQVFHSTLTTVPRPKLKLRRSGQTFLSLVPWPHGNITNKY